MIASGKEVVMHGKIYFKGLNGIRAIAAFIVIVFHIDQYLPLFGLPSFGYFETEMATYGVVLFFVLSGFLITYLLLAEKKEFRRIDIPKFYMRRILRIWPIYYLIILIAFVLLAFKIIPQTDQPFLTTGLYSFLLANVGFAFGLGFITIAPLWSVGVEEQFYAFWPLLVNKSKKILRTLLLVCFAYFFIKVIFRVFEDGPVYKLISLTSFSCMAIGGIAAYLLFTRHNWLRIIYHPVIQVISWGFLLVSIFDKPLHVASIIDKEIHSVFYAIIIINVGSNINSIVNLENKVLNFLGRISYGLYVYHMTIIVLLSYFFKDGLSKVENVPLQYLFIFVAIISLTIFISHLSFQYLEKKFINRKGKYSKIPSTSERKTLQRKPVMKAHLQNT